MRKNQMLGALYLTSVEGEVNRPSLQMAEAERLLLAY